MKIFTYLKKMLFYIKNGPNVIKNITADIYYISASNKLLGKKIIITGGGRGLGYAMAKKFISEE